MPEAEKPDRAVALREICADVGELVVWDVHIDDQLTTAVIYLFGLRESELLEFVVSEIPGRKRKTMLRSAVKTIEDEARFVISESISSTLSSKPRSAWAVSRGRGPPNMHKGGYVDHPADPGGATNLDITHTTLAAWWGRPVTKYEWTSPGDGKGAPPQAFTSR